MAGPTPGQVLNGRYELRRRIGGGSMGEVWRGRDLVLGRTVAVKIVLPALLDTPTFRARFVAEARVMAMMDHPGIVGVFDYGYAETDDPDTPGAAFLVMEFIEGESLDKVLARTGPLEPRFALKVLASLLDALAAVHRAGVVHRDVKPANVMLTSGGVVLADFGIARSPESLGLTAADALMGTVPYLAPELFQADTPTPAADVYAVGILGYELLSGRQPFQAASTAAVMYKHMHEPPPPLPDYVATPAAEVLWRALEKDAARRWTDGGDMAAAMRAVLAGPVEVGEEFGAEPDFGRPHAGNPSGYEDTLTETGGRRRGRGTRRTRGAEAGAAGPAAGAGAAAAGADAVSGYGEAVAGYGDPTAVYGDPSAAYDAPIAGFDDGGQVRSYGHEPLDPLVNPRDPLANPLDPLSDSTGRHGRTAYEPSFSEGAGDGLYGRSPYEEVFGDPVDRPDPMSDSGGRHSRAAALGEDAASDIGGRHGRTAFDDTARLDTPTEQLSAFAPDATRVFEGDSGGRRARSTDAPDATRVFDPDPGGRHAGPASETPLRRRAAEPGGGIGGASPTSRAASAAARTDAARRRTLVTAAVAAPALLGLTVALVMNSSGPSPKSPGSRPGPGAGVQADQPTTYGTSDGYDTPDTPSSSSSAYYPHSPSSRHSSGGSATSGTATQSVTGTHSYASSSPSGSPTDPSSVTTSSSIGSATSTSSALTSPTSTASSASTVPVPDVTGKTESQAQSTLTGQGFKVQVGSRSGGTGSSCTVSTQSPSGGSADYGSTVTINLSCV